MEHEHCDGCGQLKCTCPKDSTFVDRPHFQKFLREWSEQQEAAGVKYAFKRFQEDDHHRRYRTVEQIREDAMKLTTYPVRSKNGTVQVTIPED